MALEIGRTLAALTVMLRVTVVTEPEEWLTRRVTRMTPARAKLDSICDVLGPHVALKCRPTTPGPVSVQLYAVVPAERGALNRATWPASSLPPADVNRAGCGYLPVGSAASAVPAPA